MHNNKTTDMMMPSWKRWEIHVLPTRRLANQSCLNIDASLWVNHLTKRRNKTTQSYLLERFQSTTELGPDFNRLSHRLVCGGGHHFMMYQTLYNWMRRVNQSRRKEVSSWWVWKRRVKKRKNSQIIKFNSPSFIGLWLLCNGGKKKKKKWRNMWVATRQRKWTKLSIESSDRKKRK